MSVPCRCCGVATDRAVVERVMHDHTKIPKRYEVGTCARCATLRPEEPGAGVRAALRLIRRDESAWVAAAERFEALAIDVSTFMYDQGTPVPPQARAWHHVSRADKAEVRRAYAEMLARMVDPPVYTPPEGMPPGCLMCGLATGAEWFGPRTTGALTPGSARLVTGVLCPACHAAYVAVGRAFGLPALERACLEFKGLPADMEVPRLRAWVATGRPPSDVPWAHVKVRVRAPAPEPVAPEDEATRLAERVASLERQLHEAQGAR